MENVNESPDQDVTVLLSSAKQGCQRSINELFRQHEKYLLLISSCELDRGLRAKYGESDVVQNALTKAASALEGFRGSSSKEFRGWLRTILINEINQLRRAFRRASRDTALEQQLDGNSVQPGYGEQLKDRELTPQSHFLKSEQIKMVRRAVEQLPEIDQQVIKLRNWERQSFPEIAEKLNKSEEAVKKTWQRAIAKLDKLMQANES